MSVTLDSLVEQEIYCPDRLWPKVYKNTGSGRKKNQNNSTFQEDILLLGAKSKDLALYKPLKFWPILLQTL